MMAYPRALPDVDPVPDVQIVEVPPNLVRSLWPWCVDMLTPAFEAETLARACGTLDPEEVRQRCEQDTMRLWLAMRDNEVLGALVSEIQTHVKARVAVARFIGGRELSAWHKPMSAALEAAHSPRGCIGLMAVAPKKWAPLLGKPGDMALFFRKFESASLAALRPH